MSKPKFEIYTTANTPSPLDAFQVLQELDVELGHHLANGLRPPLGIYNISILRLSGRLEKCCSKLEQLFMISAHVEAVNANRYLLEEVLDYLELSLYAAAEHVDDLKLIMNGFFDSKKDFKKSANAKSFLDKLKTRRDFISSVVNSIKHEQARIRLFSLEIKHDSQDMCLHGYFVEGVSNGEVGPNKIFHDEDSTVFSITSIIWEIVSFVLNTSRDLKDFLILQLDVEPKDKLGGGEEAFLKAVIAAARLPLYSFDDEHPFLQTCITIHTDEKSKELLDSGLYGAIANGWSTSRDMQFSTSASSYSGDDVTKTFKLVAPKSVKLQHWS